MKGVSDSIELQTLRRADYMRASHPWRVARLQLRNAVSILYWAQNRVGI